jgi:hypothetical protein
MKALVILLLITYSLCQRTITHPNIPNYSFLALTSNSLPNFYLAYDASSCKNIPSGRCGTLFGTYLSQLDLLPSHNYHFLVIVMEQGFYCLSPEMLDAILGFDGKACTIRGAQQCGKTYLYKRTACTEKFGWKIGMVGNSYVFLSVTYPNVYLYFNTMGCQNNSTGCGSLTGHYMSRQDVLRGQNFQKVFFNVEILPAEHVPGV